MEQTVIRLPLLLSIGAILLLACVVAAHAQGRVTVFTPQADVRETPNVKSKSLQVVKKCESFAYIMEVDRNDSGFWVMVRLPDRDLAGWLHSSTIRLGKDVIREAAPEFYQQLAIPKAFERPRKYIRGPRGGCYYINRTGRKTYVERAICKRRQPN